MSRSILKIFSPPTLTEGQGTFVYKIIGNQHISDFNPFMLFDYASFKLPTGFPDHPHRGFETVSYLLKGSSYHEDSKGHSGHLQAGDVQWMTAGKGVVHAEMPGSWNELTFAFQLWINLQAKYKMVEPQYQEIKNESIPIAKSKGVEVKVIAGQAIGIKGSIFTRTPALYLDVKIEEQSEFQQIVPTKWNSLCFIYEGSGQFNNQNAIQHQVVLLDPKDKNEKLVVQTQKSKCHFILIAGEPINEPIVSQGPFVMNTKQEINQAFDDYQNSKNGFEGVHSWRSKIRDLSKRKQ